MNNEIKKQLLKTAVLTSPVIATFIAAPILIAKIPFNFKTYFTFWLIVLSGTILSWVINTWILTFRKKIFFNPLITIIIVSSITILIPTILFLIFKNFRPLVFLNIPVYKFQYIRIIIVVLTNVIVFILIDLIVTKESKIQLDKENSDLKFLKLEAEYKLLKDQINPHFLFNALNISKSLIKSQPKEAEKYIVELSEFLRATVNSNQKTVILKDELTLCMRYLKLQKVRFDNSLLFHINTNELMNVYYLPFFSLVTLIENAIKHNSFTDETPLKITIETIEEFVVIKNNKQFKNVTSLSRTGLLNLNQRCNLLTGNEIIIIDNEQEFLVKIKLTK